MFAFMIAAGAVFVAVVIAAVIDPRVDRADDFDELAPTTDEAALPV
jgi:hypothetical protein